jgi:hypothetical protein
MTAVISNNDTPSHQRNCDLRICSCRGLFIALKTIFMAAPCAIRELSACPVLKTRTVAQSKPIELWALLTRSSSIDTLCPVTGSHSWLLPDFITAWRCFLMCRRRPALSDAGLFLLAWLTVFRSLSKDGGCP